MYFGIEFLDALLNRAHVPDLVIPSNRGVVTAILAHLLCPVR